MVLLLLEALLALVLLVFMVWWTMFSGRKNGELKGDTTIKAGSEDAPEVPKINAEPPDKP